MTNGSHTLDALLEQLQQFSSHSSIDSSLLAIQEDANNHEHINALCQALINEGERHNQSAWAAHMTSSPTAASILGQVLAGLHNGNLLSPQLYPLLEKVEQQLINWFCHLYQHQHGHFTAGATYANLEALWQAREHASHDSTLVYGSHASHFSVAKACQILGLTFQEIDTDEYDRILPSALAEACQQQVPVAIVLTAGTSACGEIDPLTECIQISQQFQCWSHIDAAWGAGLVLLEQYQQLFNAIATADSVTIDPHKAFSQPKPCGVLLYKHPLNPLFSIDANYLEHEPKQTLPGSFGGELFLPLWSSLMFNGVASLRKQMQHRLQQAQSFSNFLAVQPNWWHHQSPTGIICFRPPEDINLDDLVNLGLFSKAKVNNSTVYRCVFASQAARADSLITALAPFC